MNETTNPVAKVTGEWRRKEGMTYRSFADALNEDLVNAGISHISVANWEQGIAEPGTDFLLTCLVAWTATLTKVAPSGRWRADRVHIQQLGGLRIKNLLQTQIRWEEHLLVNIRRSQLRRKILLGLLVPAVGMIIANFFLRDDGWEILTTVYAIPVFVVNYWEWSGSRILDRILKDEKYDPHSEDA